MKTLTKSLLITLSLVASALQAKTLYSRISGDWNAGSTWSIVNCGGASCGCVPSNGDDVIICTGYTVVSSADLYIGSGGNASSLTIQSGGTLSMGANYMDVKTGGTLVVSGNLVVDSLLFDNNSIVTVNTGGNIQVNSGFKNKNNSNTIVINGTMTVNGNADFGWGSTITGSGSVTVVGNSTGTGMVYCNYPGCIDCIFTTYCPLPITLISFTATYTNNAVCLNWSTGSETNNDYFSVERTTDGKNYSLLAQVQGAGTSSQAHSYFAIDESPASGANYYRLKQTDLDGHYTYFGLIAVRVNITTKGLKIYPDPVNKNCIIAFNDSQSECCQLNIFDSRGNNVAVKSIQATKGLNNIELDISMFARGVYFVSMPVNGLVLNSKFIKN